MLSAFMLVNFDFVFFTSLEVPFPGFELGLTDVFSLITKGGEPFESSTESV